MVSGKEGNSFYVSSCEHPYFRAYYAVREKNSSIQLELVYELMVKELSDNEGLLCSHIYSS